LTFVRKVLAASGAMPMTDSLSMPIANRFRIAGTPYSKISAFLGQKLEHFPQRMHLE